MICDITYLILLLQDKLSKEATGIAVIFFLVRLDLFVFFFLSRIKSGCFNWRRRVWSKTRTHTHTYTHTHAHTHTHTQIIGAGTSPPQEWATRTSMQSTRALNGGDVTIHPLPEEHVIKVRVWVMRCNTLQHTATHCNALQHTATHCNILQRTGMYWNTLQRTATHCNTLQCTTTRCNTLPHTAALYNTMQHSATYCNILQQTATHCNILQHNATHSSTL